MNVLRVGDKYNMIDEETSETYSIKELTNIVALHLAEDVKEYRRGNQELDKQIKLETNVLNALAKVVEVLN
jgi:CheY-specific phosphatase CheX